MLDCPKSSWGKWDYQNAAPFTLSIVFYSVKRFRPFVGIVVYWLLAGLSIWLDLKNVIVLFEILKLDST